MPIAPFAPIHRMDFGLAPFFDFNPAYMGDYDGLTTDFTGKNHRVHWRIRMDEFRHEPGREGFQVRIKSRR